MEKINNNNNNNNNNDQDQEPDQDPDPDHFLNNNMDFYKLNIRKEDQQQQQQQQQPVLNTNNSNNISTLDCVDDYSQSLLSVLKKDELEEPFVVSTTEEEPTTMRTTITTTTEEVNKESIKEEKEEQLEEKEAIALAKRKAYQEKRKAYRTRRQFRNLLKKNLFDPVFKNVYAYIDGKENENSSEVDIVRVEGEKKEMDVVVKEQEKKPEPLNPHLNPHLPVKKYEVKKKWTAQMKADANMRRKERLEKEADNNNSNKDNNYTMIINKNDNYYTKIIYSKLFNNSNAKKMLSGNLYNALDPLLVELRIKAQEFVFEYSKISPIRYHERPHFLKHILRTTGEEICIEPPFNIDYGCFTSVGENFYANFGFVCLDAGGVFIGDDVMLAPGVHIYTSHHPIDSTLRHSRGLELAHPVRIGNKVWIGGQAIINPGITIGDNVVIGSGSVITKDIPENCVVAGNPAKIIRYLKPGGEDDNDEYMMRCHGRRTMERKKRSEDHL